MNWPLLAAATTLAEVLHSTRCQAHQIPARAYLTLSAPERAALEELALRILETVPAGADLYRICDLLARHQTKIIGRITEEEPHGVSI